MDSRNCSFTRMDTGSDSGNLFEDCAWFYALCREYLFRDHTDAIASALFPEGAHSARTSILEAGCGPGFYARRLAERYPALRVLGVDQSSRLVARARARASSSGLMNCHFLQGDVERLSAFVGSFDAVISSRLLLVVANRRRVLAEMFRVLKPGGRLFLAEPTSGFKSQIPISVMRFVRRLTVSPRHQTRMQEARILGPREFEELVRSQPWGSISIEMRGDYLCALCEKRAHDAARDEAAFEDEILLNERGSLSHAL